MEDEDGPEPASIQEADRAARTANTSDLAFAAGEEAVELQPGTEDAPAEGDAGGAQDDGESPEPGVEAAGADEGGEGASPDAPEFDPEDPDTWPDDVRATHARYKRSPFELAKALSASKTSFHEELEKRVEEKVAALKAKLEPAKPAAGPPPAVTAVEPPEVREWKSEKAVLADRYDKDLDFAKELTQSYREKGQRRLELKGAEKHLKGLLEKNKDDELLSGRFSDELASVENEYIRLGLDLKTIEVDGKMANMRLNEAKARYDYLDSEIGSFTKKAKADEETSRQSEQALEDSTAEQETLIGSALKVTADKLGVPEGRRERLNRKLLRALNAQPGYVKDVGTFLETEAREEMKDWSMAKAEGAAGYGSLKRKDAAQPAPAGVAKPTGQKPLTRKDADRIAMQASRRIPIG